MDFDLDPTNEMLNGFPSSPCYFPSSPLGLGQGQEETRLEPDDIDDSAFITPSQDSSHDFQEKAYDPLHSSRLPPWEDSTQVPPEHTPAADAFFHLETEHKNKKEEHENENENKRKKQKEKEKEKEKGEEGEGEGEGEGEEGTLPLHLELEGTYDLHAIRLHAQETQTQDAILHVCLEDLQANSRQRFHEAIRALEPLRALHHPLACCIYDLFCLDPDADELRASLVEVERWAKRGHALAWHLLGLHTERSGDMERAVDYYRRSTQCFPSYIPSFYRLVLWYDVQRKNMWEARSADEDEDEDEDEDKGEDEDEDKGEDEDEHREPFTQKEKENEKETETIEADQEDFLMKMDQERESERLHRFYLTRAIQAYYPPAMLYYARSLRNGPGLVPSRASATLADEMETKAARAGSGDACFLRSCALRDRDITAAHEFLQQGAKEGHLDCMVRFLCITAEQEEWDAVWAWKDAIEQNAMDTAQLYTIAFSLVHAPSENLQVVGEALLSSAAAGEGGHKDAAREYARILSTREDDEGALAWYEIAAEKGCVISQQILTQYHGNYGNEKETQRWLMLHKEFV